MPNQTNSQTPIGTQREFVCAWCTSANKGKTTRQKHIYVEYRSHRQLECFWECVACGHQRPPSIWDNAQEQKGDPEIDRLHAQWREDNQGGTP
jgi:hypothetical protein